MALHLSGRRPAVRTELHLTGRRAAVRTTTRTTGLRRRSAVHMALRLLAAPLWTAQPAMRQLEVRPVLHLTFLRWLAVHPSLHPTFHRWLAVYTALRLLEAPRWTARPASMYRSARWVPPGTAAPAPTLVTEPVTETVHSAVHRLAVRRLPGVARVLREEAALAMGRACRRIFSLHHR